MGVGSWLGSGAFWSAGELAVAMVAGGEVTFPDVLTDLPLWKRLTQLSNCCASWMNNALTDGTSLDLVDAAEFQLLTVPGEVLPQLVSAEGGVDSI